MPARRTAVELVLEPFSALAIGESEVGIAAASEARLHWD